MAEFNRHRRFAKFVTELQQMMPDAGMVDVVEWSCKESERIFKKFQAAEKLLKKIQPVDIQNLDVQNYSADLIGVYHPNM